MTEPLRSGANFSDRETALLEALWRGDELAAALKDTRSELGAMRLRLAQAEEAILELSEIGDAAQAAIDDLRLRIAHAEEAADHYRGQRDALATEVFRLARRLEAELGEGAAGVAFVPGTGRLAGRRFGRWWWRATGWLIRRG